jgi:hypothetical protein
MQKNFPLSNFSFSNNHKVAEQSGNWFPNNKQPIENAPSGSNTKMNFLIKWTRTSGNISLNLNQNYKNHMDSSQPLYQSSSGLISPRSNSFRLSGWVKHDKESSRCCYMSLRFFRLDQLYIIHLRTSEWALIENLCAFKQFRYLNWTEISGSYFSVILKQTKLKLNSMVWVREWTIPTDRPPLVGEAIANLCG